MAITLCGVLLAVPSAHAQSGSSALAAPIQQTIKRINESTKIPADFKSKLVSQASSLLPMLSNTQNLGSVSATNQKILQTLSEVEAMSPRQQTIENLARLYAERFVNPGQSKAAPTNNAVGKIGQREVREKLAKKLSALGFNVTEEKITEMVQRAPNFFNMVMNSDRGTLKVSDLPPSELAYLEVALNRAPLEDSDLANLTKAVRGAVLDDGSSPTAVAASGGSGFGGGGKGGSGPSKAANDIASSADKKAASLAGDDITPAGSEAVAESAPTTSSEASPTEEPQAPRNYVPNYTPTTPTPSTRAPVAANANKAPTTQAPNNSNQNNNAGLDDGSKGSGGDAKAAKNSPQPSFGSGDGMPAVTEVHGRTLAGDSGSSSGKKDSTSSNSGSAPSDRDLSLALARQKYLQTMLDKMNSGDKSAHLNKSQLKNELAEINSIVKGADQAAIKKNISDPCLGVKISENPGSAGYTAQIQSLMKDASTKASLLGGYFDEASKGCKGAFCKNGLQIAFRVCKDMIAQKSTSLTLRYNGQTYEKGFSDRQLDTILNTCNSDESDFGKKSRTPELVATQLRLSGLQTFLNLSVATKNKESTDIFLKCSYLGSSSPTKALEQMEKIVRKLLLNCGPSFERTLAYNAGRIFANSVNLRSEEFAKALARSPTSAAPPGNQKIQLGQNILGLSEKKFFELLPVTNETPKNSTAAKCDQLRKFEAYALGVLSNADKKYSFGASEQKATEDSGASVH